MLLLLLSSSSPLLVLFAKSPSAESLGRFEVLLNLWEGLRNRLCRCVVVVNVVVTDAVVSVAKLLSVMMSMSSLMLYLLLLLR